jgi:hypothetical protein
VFVAIALGRDECDDRRVAGQVRELIDEGRAALRAGDGLGARRAFERALAESSSADAIEGLARAAYLALDFARAIKTGSGPMPRTAQPVTRSAPSV